MATGLGQDGIEKQRQDVGRAFALLLPAILLIASIVLLVVSPFSWGAAEVLDAPGWMPPALGIITGFGGLWIGVYSLKRVARATRGAYSVFGLQLIFGTVMFLSGAILLLWFATQLPAEATYERALDDEGEYTLAPAWFFIVSLVIGAFQLAWIWVGAYLYSNAFTNQQPNRISERDPNEVDGVAELLRERE